jgi:hypothetical protein
LDAMFQATRSPLMAISGIAQRLSRDVEERGDLRRCVNTVVSESSNLQAILDSVEPFAQRGNAAAARGDLLQPINHAMKQLQSLLVHLN